VTGLAEIWAHDGGPGGENAAAVAFTPIGFYISIQQLKIDLVWNLIRHDPGFQQLLAGKEQIGPNN
jgi:hypothetical protein